MFSLTFSSADAPEMRVRGSRAKWAVTTIQASTNQPYNYMGMQLWGEQRSRSEMRAAGWEPPEWVGDHGQRWEHAATGRRVWQAPLQGCKMEFRLRIELGKGEHMQLSDRPWHAHTAKIRAWRSRKKCNVTPSKAGMRLVGSVWAVAGQVKRNSRNETSRGLSKMEN